MILGPSEPGRRCECGQPATTEVEFSWDGPLRDLCDTCLNRLPQPADDFLASLEAWELDPWEPDP